MVTSLLVSNTDMYSGSKDGNIKHWDLLSRSEVSQRYTAHSRDWCSDLTFVEYDNFVESNKLIASVGRDRAVRIWGPERLDPLCEVDKAHKSSINSVCNYGNLIFTGSDDFNIGMWKINL